MGFMGNQKIKTKQLDMDDLKSHFVEKHTYTATILASSWVLDTDTNMYLQTVTVNGIRSTDTPYITPVRTDNITIDKEIMKNWDSIYRIKTTINAIMVYSTENILSENLSINIVVYR